MLNSSSNVTNKIPPTDLGTNDPEIYSEWHSDSPVETDPSTLAKNFDLDEDVLELRVVEFKLESMVVSELKTSAGRTFAE